MAIIISRDDVPEYIVLKVHSQDNSVLKFKIKRHISLRRLMVAYSTMKGLELRRLRFSFNLQFICENDTPASLEMEDFDIIYVYREQGGPDDSFLY